MNAILYLSFLWIYFENVNCIFNEYYVSVKGSDEWDGTLPENIPSTKTGPWRTVKHAITQLRKLRPSYPGPEDETTIYIKEGIYYQPETLWLDHRESFLNIAAYNNEVVSISGGYPLTPQNSNWNKEGEIIHAEFIGSCPSEAFYENYRLLPARGPNTDWGLNMNIAKEPYNVITGLLEETNSCKRNSHAYTQSCPDSDRNGFVFTDEISEDWEYLNQTEILVFHSWIAEYAKIANISVENGKKRVMFQNPLKHAAVGTQVKPSGWRFLLFNNLALLDNPGEYVCVEEGEMAKFSYIPPISTIIPTVPILGILETILVLQGGATNVNIQGIKFQHTSSGGHDGYNFGTQSAIRIWSSTDIKIEDCQFSHTGMTALYITNSRRIIVQTSSFFDIGYHGIQALYANVNDNMEDIMIRNNLFDGCGTSRFWQPGCLWIGGLNNISVINNEFTNTAYMGVGIISRMPHGDKFWSDNGIIEPTRDDYVFHIEFNHFHDFGNGVLNDYGAVYMNAGGISCYTAPEEEVRKKCYTYIHVFNNLIHDSRSYLDDAASMYSDSGSCRNTYENNIMYGDGGQPLYHHCGLDNVSKNNIIHRRTSRSPPDTIWGGCEKSSPGLQNYSNSHNIYLLDNADGLSFGRSWDRYYNEAPNFHHNLYWSSQVEDEHLQLFPDKLTWNEWVTTGNDTTSLWANPLFLDPYQGLYLLTEDSPAWDLGIKQIQLDNFGIQKKMKYQTMY